MILKCEDVNLFLGPIDITNRTIIFETESTDFITVYADGQRYTSENMEIISAIFVMDAGATFVEWRKDDLD